MLLTYELTNQKFLILCSIFWIIPEDIVNCIHYVISGKLDKLLINESQV